MTAWLPLALTGPVLWAVSTHIDKYLVDRYFANSDTAVLMVFTALLSATLLIPIALFAHGVFDVHLRDVAVLIVPPDVTTPDRAMVINLREDAAPGLFDRVLEVVAAEQSERDGSRKRWSMYKAAGFDVAKHDM